MWANQYRIFTQQVANLGRVLGNLFLPIVKTVIPYVNALLMVLRKLFTMLGFTLYGDNWLKDLNEGISSVNFGDVTDGLEDIEEGANGAAGAAKKLKNALAPIDELNIINQDSSSGGSGSGAGGGGNIDLSDKINDAVLNYENKWQEAFDKMGNKAQKIADVLNSYIDRGDWKGLGRSIANHLTEALNSIDWDKIYKRAENFGKGFAEFLNGLFSPELFKAVGKTIAASLNTAIYAALSFAKNFDFKNFGKAIASGINSFFKTFDTKALAQTINAYIKGALTTVATMLKETDFELIGKKIGQFLVELDFTGTIAKLGKVIWEAIKAAFKLLNSLFQTAPLETILLGVFALLNFTSLGTVVSQGIAGSIAKFLAPNLGVVLNGQSATILGVLTQGLLNPFVKFGTMFGDSFALLTSVGVGHISAFAQSAVFSFSQVMSNLTALQKGIVSAIAGFAEFSLVSGAFEDLTLGAEHLGKDIAQLASGIAIAGAAFVGMFGVPAGLIITGIIGVIGALKGINDAWNEIAHNEAMASIGDTLRNNLGTPIEEITQSTVAMINETSNGFSAIAEKGAELATTKDSITSTASSISEIGAAINAGAYTADEKIPEIVDKFNQLLTDSQSVFDQEYDVIVSGIVGALGEAAGYSEEEASKIIGNLAQIKGGYDDTVADIKNQQMELQKKYEDGTLSAQEYGTQIFSLAKELNELTGQTDIATKATESIAKASEGVNFDKWLNDDNSLSASNFANSLEDVSVAALDAYKSISEENESVTAALEDYIREAERVGDTETAALLGDMLEDQAEQMKKAQGDVEKQVTEYTDMIQTKFIEDIPNVVNEATEKYKEKGFFYKLTHSEADYVDQYMQDYQNNVINPATEEIKNMYDDLGLEVEPWVGDISKSIVDSMFDEQWIVNADGSQTYSRTLNRTYVDSIREATNGLEEEAAKGGGYCVSGFFKGIEENEGDVQKAAEGMGNKFLETFYSILKIHSPSRVMIEAGGYTVEGYNMGIRNNISSSISTIAEWVKSFLEQFRKDTTTGKFTENIGSIKDAFIVRWNDFRKWFDNIAIVDFWRFYKEQNTDKQYTNHIGSIKEGFKVPWNTFTNWFKDTAMVDFWRFYKEQNTSNQYTNHIGSIKNGFNVKWKEFRDWFNTIAIVEWWNKYKSENTSEQYTKHIGSIKNGFKVKWDEFTKWLYDTAFVKFWDKVSKNFEQKKWEFDGIKKGLEASMTKALNSVKTMWNKFAEWINANLTWTIDPIEIAGQTVFDGATIQLAHLPTFSVAAYANGGFPNQGDLFIANEAGAELVGSMGGRTTVANQMEITDGIADGVRQAVADALVPYLREIANNTEETAKKDYSVKLDGKDISRSVNNAQRRTGFTFRTT